MESDADTASLQRLQHALHLAWIIWVAILLMTLLALLATVIIVHNEVPTDAGAESARRWLWAVAGYYVVIVPIAFFRTTWLFRSYYSYRPVAPRTYLTGMTIVWLALAIGAWISLAVCIFTRTLLPNILFAGVGNVMLLALWPRGNAMAPPAGDPADPGQYQEPR